MTKGLAYIGKIVGLDPIENADNIMLATVICGVGGKWRGVVRKRDFLPLDKCIVFLPDALVPECDEMRFMEKSGWRVKMQRFRGAPSEVLIMPHPEQDLQLTGEDVTEQYGVRKYIKPVPESLQGTAKGAFPGFIPKTDELDWQRVPEMVKELKGKPYYISQKCDGSSTTAYKWHGVFGICSRNWELEKEEENGFWKVAQKYDLENRLPEGMALQWETCGPKIQKNPMQLRHTSGFAFNAYNIDKHEYLEYNAFMEFCKKLNFPICKVLEWGVEFAYDGDLGPLAKGKYEDHVHEGIVIRSCWNVGNGKPISFKVINLDYENG